MTFTEWSKTAEGKTACDETRPHLAGVELAYGRGYRLGGDDYRDDHRYGFDAAHRPTLRTGVELHKQDAAALLEWYEAEETRLSADGWKEWNPAMMALRTICIQIETYEARAFKREAGLFD